MDANMAVFEESKRIKARVGTTASMLCFNGNKVNVCNIGDSPIFLFNDYGLVPIFEEHTGRKTAERIFGKDKVPQKKYPLTQHIGIDPDEMIIVPFANTLEVQAGSQYLICSDGLTDMVKEERISEVSNSVSDKVSILFEEALQNGGKDNITIILIQTKEIKSFLPKIAGIAGGALVLLIGIIFGVTMLLRKGENPEPPREEYIEQKENVVENGQESFEPEDNSQQNYNEENPTFENYERNEREKGNILPDHSDKYQGGNTMSGT